MDVDRLRHLGLLMRAKQNPLGRGGGVNSVGVKKWKNRQTVRASLSRVYGVSCSVQQRQHLIGLRESRVHQSTAERWQPE